MVEEPEEADSGWPNLPRKYVVWAIVGWIVVAAVAYGIAWLAGWTTLTEGRALIFLLVGAPYWLAIIAVFNLLDSKRKDAKRS